MSAFLHDFAQAFAGLNKNNLERLSSSTAATRCSAIRCMKCAGWPACSAIFAEMYANVSELRFDFYGFDQVSEGEGYLRWTMSYRHPRLAAGQLIRVEGCSHLLWSDGKVHRHRDYFDAGALLYEHLPVMGSLICWLKRRLA